MSQILLTQEGSVPDNQDPIRAALVNALGALSAAEAPTVGMVLKLVDGKIGWYPVRMQIPPLAYIAPVPGNVKPADTSVLATLTALTTSLKNLILEHQNLLKSHNDLMAGLVAGNYMLPKPTA